VLEQTLPHDLQAAVNALPEPFRTTLLLIDVHGLSYADTAAALDIPLGTVMSRLSRARNRLRRHLRPHRDPEGPT
jgi:RNA polymerase sigma-70 factor (ECF subfamily)